MIYRVLFLTVAFLLILNPLSAHADALSSYKSWADVKYGTLSDDDKKAKLTKLEQDLAALLVKNPKDVNAKIVLATVKSTHASLIGGLSALPHVKSAKKLFEESIKADEKAMDGQAHAILGALYYGVPGWPVAFGDNDKAEMHIKKALKIAPNSIDANFFWGDYWLEKNRHGKAKEAFDKTLTLKPRSTNPAYKAADMGRLDEAREKLKTVEEKLKQKAKKKSSSSFNE